MVSEVATRLRKAAGLPSKPTGVVANGSGNGTAKSASRAKPKRKAATAHT
jgi:hypothetical protein